MNKYNTLIIDDDIENINILKIYLKQYYSFINVIAEATNVNDGVIEYVKTKPEILLLDIELGDENIFDFLDSIGTTQSEIVFVSSHEKYGVKAVNYNVTGFLVKPIDVNQLKKTISKTIFNIENRYSIQGKTTNEYPTNIAIPSIDKIELIPNNSIQHLEANGKYTVFHLIDGKEKIASRNLGEYEKILNPKNFFRIHHRYLINVNKVTNIHKTDGSYCELMSGKNLPIAKRRQDDFQKFLKLK